MGAKSTGNIDCEEGGDAGFKPLKADFRPPYKSLHIMMRDKD